jgi:hypothetical protein
LAKYIVKNDSIELRNKILTIDSLKSAEYLGKNLSHYLITNSRNFDLIKWAVFNLGTPSSSYGMNTKDLLSIRSLYNTDIKLKLDLLDRLLPSIVANQSITRKLNFYLKGR